MDELGRGTSTFNGTTIAHGAVHHLVTKCKCLSLFATHYHSLLEEWGNDCKVRLGHMQCLVEKKDSELTLESEIIQETEQSGNRITFLYTLGDGVCPKSFGINVARLAKLPEEVLTKAEKISCEFESKTNTTLTKSSLQRNIIIESLECTDWDSLLRIWENLQV